MGSLEKMTRKRLGELLVADGLITEEQVNEALEIQQRSGEILGEILVKRGWVTESDVARCLCAQFQRPFIRANSYDIPKECHTIVPVQMLVENQFVILDKFRETIIIAMGGIVKQTVLDAIKENTGCDIEVFIATMSDIRNTHRKLYPDYYVPGSEEPVFDTTMATNITDPEALAKAAARSGGNGEAGEGGGEAGEESVAELSEDEYNWEALFEEAEQRVMTDLQAKTAEIDKKDGVEPPAKHAAAAAPAGKNGSAEPAAEDISDDDVEGILDQVLGEADG